MAGRQRDVLSVCAVGVGPTLAVRLAGAGVTLRDDVQGIFRCDDKRRRWACFGAVRAQARWNASCYQSAAPIKRLHTYKHAQSKGFGEACDRRKSAKGQIYHRWRWGGLTRCRQLRAINTNPKPETLEGGMGHEPAYQQPRPIKPAAGWCAAAAGWAGGWAAGRGQLVWVAMKTGRRKCVITT